MEPTIYKPGAYKSPGVYNGAGGIYKGFGLYKDGQGKKYYEEFGGITYEVVKINNLWWTTTNLKNYTSGALYFKNDVIYAELGYLYPTDSIISDTNTQSAFIESLVHDGWRVPTKADLETLSIIPLEELKNNLWTIPGNNKSGFNAYPSGYRGQGGSWSNLQDGLTIISQSVVKGGTAYFGMCTNGSFYVGSNSGAITGEYYRLRSVRLCKDA